MDRFTTGLTAANRPTSTSIYNKNHRRVRLLRAFLCPTLLSIRHLQIERRAPEDTPAKQVTHGTRRLFLKFFCMFNYVCHRMKSLKHSSCKSIFLKKCNSVKSYI